MLVARGTSFAVAVIESSKHMHLDTKAYLVFIYLMLFFIPLQAQKRNYSPGYIISLEGDTLKGWVKDRSNGAFTEIYSAIRFKGKKALFRKKYKPHTIRAYACNERVYESVPLKEETSFFRFRYVIDQSYKKVFLRVIAREEPLTYYHWEYVDDESNYLDHIPLFYLTGAREMVRVTQGILGLKRRSLIEYFHDCYELADAIYTKRLNEIDEVYNFYLNNCIDP